MRCKDNASTIPGLPIKDVNKLMIQLPALPTQEKIVNILKNGNHNDFICKISVL